MTDEREVAPRQRGMTPVRVTLAAGVPKRFDIAGDWFHVKTAPVDDLVVRFDDGEPVPVSQGIGFRRYYQGLELESATGQAVLCYAGFGSVTDGRASVTGLTLNTTIAPGNTFDDGGDVEVPDSTITQLLAADADRLYAKVALPSDAAGSIRVGTNAVTAASGDLVEPGMSVPIATTAALYAYHEAGVAIDVVVSSVRKV